MVTSKPIRRSVYAGLVHMGLLLPDGFGVAQLLLGYHRAKAVPGTGIALSYKKNLYWKVNYSKSAVAFCVTITGLDHFHVGVGAAALAKHNQEASASSRLPSRWSRSVCRVFRIALRNVSSLSGC